MKNILIILILVSLASTIKAAQPQIAPSNPKEFITLYENASPFAILQLTPQATPTEINSAFRKNSLKWHPDRWPNQQDDATQAFKIVNSARDKLIALKEPEAQNPKPAESQNADPSEPQNNTDAKIIQLDNNTTFDLNQKMPNSNRTYDSIFESQRAHNMAFVLAKVEYVDIRLEVTILDVITLSHLLHYQNLTNASNYLLLHQKDISAITYYFIEPNNTMEAKRIIYPSYHSTEPFFIVTIDKILSNLSQSQIAYMINDLLKNVVRQPNSASSNWLLRLLKSNKTTVRDKIYAGKHLSQISLDQHLLYQVLELLVAALGESINQHEINELIETLKLYRNKPAVGGYTTIHSLLSLSTKISKKVIIELIFDLLVNNKSTTLPLNEMYIIHLVKTLEKLNIPLIEKTEFKDLIIEELKKLPLHRSGGEIFRYTDCIFKLDQQDFYYIPLKMYEFLHTQPNLPCARKIEVLKNLAYLLQRAQPDLQDKSKALLLYEQLLTKPELASHLDAYQKLDIHFNMGLIYATGALGVEKNTAQAIAQFEMITNDPSISGGRKGNRKIKSLKPQADFQLGKIYFTGSSQVPKDLNVAKKYFSEANASSSEYAKSIKPEIKNYMNQINAQLKTEAQSEKPSKKRSLSQAEEQPASKKPNTNQSNPDSGDHAHMAAAGRY